MAEDNFMDEGWGKKLVKFYTKSATKVKCACDNSKNTDLSKAVGSVGEIHPQTHKHTDTCTRVHTHTHTQAYTHTAGEWRRQ